jgi:hypothetical protein
MTDEGDQARLREICEELLGPIRPVTDHAAAASNNGQIPGRDLQQDIVVVVGFAKHP